MYFFLQLFVAFSFVHQGLGVLKWWVDIQSSFEFCVIVNSTVDHANVIVPRNDKEHLCGI